MMAMPMSTKRVLRKCMAWETKRHVLIIELSLKVLGVSQDKDSERTSSTSKGNFLVEVDKDSRSKTDHKGPHMLC